MSFYSSVCLVANRGVRAPSNTEAKAFMLECDVIEPGHADSPFGNLSKDLVQYFANHVAHKENDRFFTPDTISMQRGIEIMDPEGDYEGSGYSISINGYGYFFPLEVVDFKEFLSLPKIVSLQQKAEKQFGGRFKAPLIRGRRVLADTLISSEGEWAWFGSQSL